jgi:type II secretion system protein H
MRCSHLATFASRGFTLVELMVVLVVIGIVTAVVLPEMRGSYEDALLRATTRKILDLSALASSRAVTLNVEERLRIDPTSGEYELDSPRHPSAREDGNRVRVESEKGTLDVRIKIQIRDLRGFAEADEHENAVPVALPPIDNVLRFFPNGTSENREVLLTDRQGFQRALQMDPITARFRVTEIAKE